MDEAKKRTSETLLAQANEGGSRSYTIAAVLLESLCSLGMAKQAVAFKDSVGNVVGNEGVWGGKGWSDVCDRVGKMHV